MKKIMLVFLLVIIVIGCTVMVERVDESTGEKFIAGYADTSILDSPITETALEYNPITKKKRFMVSVKVVNFTREAVKFNIKTIEIISGKKTLVLQNQSETHYEQKLDTLTEKEKEEETLYILHISTTKTPLADEQFAEFEEIIMSPGSLIRVTDELGNQLSSRFTKKGGMKKLFERIKEDK